MLANFALWRESADEFRALLPRDLAGPVHGAPADVRASLEGRRWPTSRTLRCASASADRGATEAMRADLRRRPGACSRRRAMTMRPSLGLPGPRYVAFAAPAIARECRRAPRASGGRGPVCGLAMADDPRRRSRWSRPPTQDQFVAQIGQLGPARRHQFQEGLLYRAGDHRPDAVSRSPEGAPVRLSRRGERRARRAALRARSADQPCGIVVNAAPAPDAGTDLLAVVPFAAIAEGGLHVGAPDGPVLIRRFRCRTRCRAPAVRAARGRWSPQVALPMCLALVALDAHPALHARHRRESRRAPCARLPRPPPGGRKGGSPDAISSPAARGSASTATAASRS